MRTFTLFCAKTSDFSKFMVCPHGLGGIKPVRTLFGQGRRVSIFEILCGCLLWTALYTMLLQKKSVLLQMCVTEYKEPPGRDIAYSIVFIYSVKFPQVAF